jgi:hypothetical protein
MRQQHPHKRCKIRVLRDPRGITTGVITGQDCGRCTTNLGETWSVPYSVAQAGGDRGYPDSVQLANGKILVHRGIPGNGEV